MATSKKAQPEWWFDKFFDYSTLFIGGLLVLMGLVGVLFPSQAIQEHLGLRVFMILPMATGAGMVWHSLRMRPHLLRWFKSGGPKNTFIKEDTRRQSR